MLTVLKRRRASPGQCLGAIVSQILVLVLALGVAPMQAQTIIAPGQSKLLDVADDATCTLVKPPELTNLGCIFAGNQVFIFEDLGTPTAPAPACIADKNARTLKIDAGKAKLSFENASWPCSGDADPLNPPLPLNGGLRSASSIARLINFFKIMEAPTQPASASLPVQISTEVNWDGILLPIPWLVRPAIAQVVGTLQVRDTSNGEVVASNTFLLERADKTNYQGCDNFPLCSIANYADAVVAISNSTGVDLTAHLIRGREYAIEVEAKCNFTGVSYVQAFYPDSDPNDNVGRDSWRFISIEGFRGCFFGINQFDFVKVNTDGFTVAPITVTVLDDRVPPLIDAVPVIVEIDIKPGSPENTINLTSPGAIPVAILSSAEFDATTVDPQTVTLAGNSVRLRGNGDPQATFKDVNKDGVTDLVIHIDLEPETLEISETDLSATLTGSTSPDGVRFRGSDFIRVIP